jgi:hypothetical protein
MMILFPQQSILFLFQRKGSRLVWKAFVKIDEGNVNIGFSILRKTNEKLASSDCATGKVEANSLGKQQTLLSAGRTTHPTHTPRDQPAASCAPSALALSRSFRNNPSIA